MIKTQFDSHGEGWTPEVIDELADVLLNLVGVFSLSHQSRRMHFAAVQGYGAAGK